MTHEAAPEGTEAAREAAGDAEPALPAPPDAERSSFRYGRSYTIELGPGGFRAPRWPGGGDELVAYPEITHVALDSRALAIGTRRGVLLLGHAQLGDSAVALEAAIRARVAAQPGGPRRLEEFARLDRKLTRRPLVALGLVGLCIVAFVLQALLPGFYDASVYRQPLPQLGEPWRYLTTQFLHVNLGHLFVNAIAIGLAGAFVERGAGRVATLFIAGVSGLCAMLASQAWGNYAELLGASGIAAGLFGGLAALELLAPEDLPATARIPRNLLLGVVLLQIAIDRFLPSLAPALFPPTAGWAHAGGFAGGALAALIVRDRARAVVRAGAAATALVTAVAFGAVGFQLVRPERSLERRAQALLEGPILNPGELNNVAWAIATSKSPSKAALATAAELAETAVSLTGGQEPTILDTLAEVYFQQGRREQAVATIDAAIALAPGETYYEQQRRRFTGERAAEDRPEEPPQAQPPAPRGRGPQRDDDEGLAPGEADLPPGDEVTV
jgi:rhomboid protease GluP